MNELQTNALAILKSWFDKADNWQKDLFYQLWQGNEDVEKLVSRSFSLAKVEYLGEKSKFVPVVEFPTEMTFSDSNSCPIILKSISDVKGIGALAPTRPLVFGDNLTIVYGENGCGKSSYVRILKSAVSPKNSASILSNVYKKDSPAPQASLTYSDDGEEHTIIWRPNLNVSCPLNIYDSSIAKRFAEEKNEVIYEPHILSILSIMTKVFEGVKTEFEKLEKDNSDLQGTMDEDIANQEIILKFLSLKSIKEFNRFIEGIVWNENTQSELCTLQEVLQENDPAKQLKTLTSQKELIEKQFQTIISLAEKTGTSFSDNYLIQRKNQIETKREADRLLQGLHEVSDWNDTGSDKWRKLWSDAVRFSQEISSENTDEIMYEGKCVLCQQILSDDAINRLKIFSEFMTSSAIKKSEKAYSDFQSTVEYLQREYSQINIEQTETLLKSTGLPDKLIDSLMSYYKTIASRCKWLLEYNNNINSSIPDSPEILQLQQIRSTIVSDYMAKIKALKDILSDRDEQIGKLKALLVKKWIFENKSNRKRGIQIRNGLSGCKTNALTSMKKSLTQILITETYISRFNDEMLMMDNSHKIKVELVSNAEKGKAYHQVALRGAVQKKKTGEVLSEGEFRVVSLAAFLADLSSWNKILPFIFDDPITSLDHKYEKMVADRLVKLSTERQVIVFTHRLAFAQLLVSSIGEYNKAHSELETPLIIDCKQIELRNRPLGEPTEPTYHGALKMKNALNNIKSRDIALLKKQYKNGEYESYDNGIKSLCSDIRKIVEQGIETDLLCKIVTRFGYSVNTLRLKYLYAVTKSDIDLFNNMMTKYSAYEHSQSTERPVELPELSVIETDVDSLVLWCDDFKKRCKDVDNGK